MSAGSDSGNPEVGASHAEPIRRLLAEKMGIVPGTLRQAPSALAARYASQWAPVEALAAHLRWLPAAALRFLANHRRGYLLIDTSTNYQPAEAEVQGRLRSNVVHIALTDLADTLICLSVVGELLDHLLGCHGCADGPWLSDGGGITPALAELGQRVRRLYDLGYGVDGPARLSRRAYLARSLGWYAIDRPQLNVADPRMERLLRHSLMDERFWERLSRPSRRDPFIRT